MAFDTGSRNPRQRRIAPSYVGSRPVRTPQAQAMRAVSRASTTGHPVFAAQQEGRPSVFPLAFALNRQFAMPGPYQTPLSPPVEAAFKQWAQHVKALTGIRVPVRGKTDYDYRGYFKATGGKIPNGHYPDRFKTPMDTTFSAQSKYATPDNPLVWRGDKLVNRNTGLVVIG